MKHRSNADRTYLGNEAGMKESRAHRYVEGEAMRNPVPYKLDVCGEGAPEKG